MKMIAIALFLTVAVNANFFQEEDKQMHIAVTTMVGFVASNVAVESGYTVAQSFWIGVGSALLVGLAKEAYDSRSGGTGFDSRDMLADGIGGVVGSAPIFVIYRW